MRQTRVTSHERADLSIGWEACSSPANSETGPGYPDGARWLPARVPGTAAAALADSGLLRPGANVDLDAADWWFRVSFPGAPAAPGEELILGLDGIATVAEVYLNGELVLESQSMFAAHEVDVGRLVGAENELVLRCHALGPMLEAPRRPRARWRTRLATGNLRFFRTMLLGRAPGFAPGPATVGPWRPVWLERRRKLVLERLQILPAISAGDGQLDVSAQLRPLAGVALEAAELVCEGPTGTHRLAVALEAQRTEAGALIALSGRLRIPSVARWWPHTHGRPALYSVTLIVTADGEQVSLKAGRTGFRSLAFGSGPGHDITREGIELHVNGTRVFARGAVWTPLDIIGMAPSEQALRKALLLVREAGMNMLRIPGTAAYETSVFHDICDELGILVWQDFMFANFDYPIEDPLLRPLIDQEVEEVLDALVSRPSLAVLCGNSEVEQQAAMGGPNPSAGRNELFGEAIPTAIARRGANVAYVPSAPCGGDLPFRPDRGIAHYFGVGGYLRPLEDARRSGVRFAAECLAFANVPDRPVLEMLAGAGGPRELIIGGVAWKSGVPRDAGADWDFDDVRDHYLRDAFALDPDELRAMDPDRYLTLSQILTGELMAEVLGEWRRQDSGCGGGLVLWLQDLVPGAGWGVLDCRGEPKAAYFHLKRALAPVSVWTIDEGLGGVAVHVANDSPAPLSARLRIALYGPLQHRHEQAVEEIELAGNEALSRNVEAALGHFVDVNWAYRFGPPTTHVIIASLERESSSGVELLSQSFRFPAGRPAAPETAESLGLRASVRALGEDLLELSVQSERLAYGVRVDVPSFTPEEDAFSVEPGGRRILRLRARKPGARFEDGSLTAVNLLGRLAISSA